VVKPQLRLITLAAVVAVAARHLQRMERVVSVVAVMVLRATQQELLVLRTAAAEAAARTSTPLERMLVVLAARESC
jgi:hypothetical protein